MYRRTYCPSHSDFRSFYNAQAGSGFSDIEVFRGAPYQRGYGLGSLFKRFALPVVKFIGKNLLKTGLNVGSDVLEKRPFKESLKARGKEGLRLAAKDTLAKADNLLNQTGTGLRRRVYKRKRKPKRVKKKKVKRPKRRVKRTKRRIKTKEIFT